MPNFSRRDLLKFFGAGSTIVPFVGGSQLAVAKLIEVPKVQIIEPPKPEILHPFHRSDVVGAEVILKMRDGTTRKREHFDFSYYPIDFLEATKRYFGSSVCVTCGSPCQSFSCTEKDRPSYEEELDRWQSWGIKKGIIR